MTRKIWISTICPLPPTKGIWKMNMNVGWILDGTLNPSKLWPWILSIHHMPKKFDWKFASDTLNPKHHQRVIMKILDPPKSHIAKQIWKINMKIQWIYKLPLTHLQPFIHWFSTLFTCQKNQLEIDKCHQHVIMDVLWSWSQLVQRAKP